MAWCCIIKKLWILKVLVCKHLQPWFCRRVRLVKLVCTICTIYSKFLLMAFLAAGRLIPNTAIPTHRRALWLVCNLWHHNTYQTLPFSSSCNSLTLRSLSDAEDTGREIRKHVLTSDLGNKCSWAMKAIIKPRQAKWRSSGLVDQLNNLDEPRPTKHPKPWSGQNATHAWPQSIRTHTHLARSISSTVHDFFMWLLHH